MASETITSLDQLEQCAACLGYGDVHAGTRFSEACGTCNHTGWANATEHVCPHCDMNVIPMDPHTVYGRQVWHNECIREAMRDPNAAELLFVRNDLSALVSAFVAVRRAFEAYPLEPMMPMEKNRHAEKMLAMEAELARIGVKVNMLVRAMDPQGDE